LNENKSHRREKHYDIVLKSIVVMNEM